MKVLRITAVGSLACAAVIGPNVARAAGCGDIAAINRSIQAARQQLRAAVEHDGPRKELGQVCRLSVQIDQGVRRMLAILEGDPRHCGRSPAVVQRLRNGATHLYLRTPCPYASRPEGPLTPAG